MGAAPVRPVAFVAVAVAVAVAVTLALAGSGRVLLACLTRRAVMVVSGLPAVVRVPGRRALIVAVFMARGVLAVVCVARRDAVPVSDGATAGRSMAPLTVLAGRGVMSVSKSAAVPRVTVAVVSLGLGSALFDGRRRSGRCRSGWCRSGRCRSGGRRSGGRRRRGRRWARPRPAVGARRPCGWFAAVVGGPVRRTADRRHRRVAAGLSRGPGGGRGSSRGFRRDRAVAPACCRRR